MLTRMALGTGESGGLNSQLEPIFRSKANSSATHGNAKKKTPTPFIERNHIPNKAFLKKEKKKKRMKYLGPLAILNRPSCMYWEAYFNLTP